MISSFTGEYSFLSNFHKVNIHNPIVDIFFDKPHIYPSVEHAYQAAKTHDINERMQISLAATPGIAKKLGSKVNLREDWDQVKIQIMYNLVSEKFKKKSLREKLLATQPHFLCEGNYWHDNFWGYCECEKCRKIPKQNHLGQILMKVRDQIWTCTNTF